MQPKNRNMRKIGYIIILLALGLSVYAAPARRGKMPVAHAPQAVGAPKPVPRVLVILTGYSDLAIQAKNTANALDSLFNEPGYDYNYATGSVQKYFADQSNGAYQPVFDVVGPVTLANNRKYYGENNSAGNDRRAKEMIKEACQAVDAIVDFSQYDSDGDGKVDAVYVIYAGIGANDIGGINDAIWPHQSTVSGLTLDGKQIYTYACSGEIDGVALDRTGIGPIVHEFGHAIGMPDYYAGDDYVFGEWSVMTYGMYNNGANTPPNYSLFDKEYMGWTTVEELAVDSQADIVLTTNYGAGYKFNAGDATYYVEYRPLTGWDIGLPGGGMLLWQVKFSASAWSSNSVNTSGSPRYTVYSAANGLMMHDGDHGGAWSSAADPFPGTQNVTSWTTYEGFAITEITEANGQITFKLNGGAPVDPTDIVTANDEGQKANGQKIIRNGQLIIIWGEKAYNAQGVEIR